MGEQWLDNTIKNTEEVSRKAEINGYGVPHYQTLIKYVKDGNINIIKSI